MSCDCGLVYYILPPNSPYHLERRLPRVKQSVHTTIVSTTSRTVLSQAFTNDTKDIIDECRYDFPLYDGVSVVGFTCQIGSRIIEGVVKERKKAKEVYDDAVALGETAGLLTQGSTSDVFSTSLGNVPAGETILVKVTYIGELKHDISANCTKFTIPTRIAPRYGGSSAFNAPWSQPNYSHTLFPQPNTDGTSNGMEITVDINMEGGSIIREVRSPSHPIAVKLGSTSTAASTQAPQMSRASASLSQGSAELDNDFVLEIVNHATEKPRALLETFADDPRQRALMVTLVPAIVLAPAKPEIIIVADRSGSMGGHKITTLMRALKIFLKSLPVGIYFNICSFGSSHSFLWKESHSYDEKSLATALQHVESFTANYGGTETLSAVRSSIESRDGKQDLALVLCTDGDIWQQEELFSYLNDQLAASPKPIRVFSLGIGNAVSSALIEGVARAGKGFASAVGENEKLDGKIVRMLKGALTENVNDYHFDVKYGSNEEEEDEDGFLLIESVTESLQSVSLEALESSAMVLSKAQLPDSSVTSIHSSPTTASFLKYLQAPQDIPPLYPSTRTTIYVMISPDAPQKQPTAVTLKGTSSQGSISIEIPVEKILEPGKTIHQLAARKAVGELEEGRGWLSHAKDSSGKLLKERCGPQSSFSQFGGKPKEPNFEAIVEREAVRLGVEYQVGSRFCSFVAVEGEKEIEQSERDQNSSLQAPQRRRIRESGYRAGPSLFGARSAAPSGPGGALFGAPVNQSQSYDYGGGAAFGAPAYQTQSLGDGVARLCSTRGGPPDEQFEALGSSTRSSGPRQTRRERKSVARSTAFEASTDLRREDLQELAALPAAGRPAPAPGKKGSLGGRGGPKGSLYFSDDNDTSHMQEDPLDAIISLQRFQGFWDLDQALLDACGVGPKAAALKGKESQTRIWATILAISFLERKLASEKDTWELIVDKARGWLKNAGVDVEEEGGKEPLRGVVATL